jgi:MYXO-CTERM domain-containing protein
VSGYSYSNSAGAGGKVGASCDVAASGPASSGSLFGVLGLALGGAVGAIRRRRARG